jgi:hypothetical protein
MGLRSHLRAVALVSGGALLAGLLVTAAPAGAATPTCAGKKATIVGHGESITGTNNADVIVGTDNGEYIDGRGGSDLICSLGGADTIDGGAGSDDIYSGGGDDVVRGDDGTDRADGGGGFDFCQAEATSNCETAGGTGGAFSVSDASGDDYAPGTINLVFTVSLSAPQAKRVTVDYHTEPGTATEGSDYAYTAGTLVFEPGDTSKQVVVQVYDNTVNSCEPDETVYLYLTNATGGTGYADGSGVGVIHDTFDCAF